MAAKVAQANGKTEHDCTDSLFQPCLNWPEEGNRTQEACNMSDAEWEPFFQQTACLPEFYEIITCVGPSMHARIASVKRMRTCQRISKRSTI